MNTTSRIFTTLLLLLLGTPAQATPALQQEIAQARERSPEAFARLEALRVQVIAQPPAWERRGQVGRAMKALGADGLLPLLAMLTHLEPLRSASAAAREMLLVGAIEAVGALHDRRSAPVMRQLLDGPESSAAPVARAAAEALGALADLPDGDGELSFLVERATAGHPRERASIAGLGFARRPAAVAALRARLESAPSPGLTEVIAGAMGWLGSSWAWNALGPGRADEGLALRDELSASLVPAYAASSGRAREAIGRALLMIDHPATPNRLAALHATSDPTLAADLQELERRWLRLR